MYENFNNRKSENCQTQRENLVYTENKIKIDEMKRNLIREHTKVTNTDQNNKKTTHADKVDKLC